MSDQPFAISVSVEARLRGILCSLAIFAFLFTPVELLLLEHTGDWVQLIPFAACFFGLVAAGWVLVEPSAMRIRNARLLSGAVVLTALIGSIRHLLHNLELELELHADTSWMEALWPSLHGAAPFLAPGILILGALMVLGATYRHPAA